MGPCHNCHAGCCRGLAVPITGADILTIQKKLGIAFRDFVCCWPDSAGRIARDQVPHFYFAEAPDVPFVICLNHADAVFLPGTSKCRFLIECPPDADHPLGQGRCGIYDSRPLACRIYPTKLNSSTDLTILCDVPARGRDGNEPAYELCPRQWECSEIDPIRSSQDLAVCRYELQFFAKVAQVWNRLPRPWGVFPEFLEAVYSRRVQKEELPELEVDDSETDEVVSIPFARPVRQAA